MEYFNYRWKSLYNSDLIPTVPLRDSSKIGEELYLKKHPKETGYGYSL